ncbi:MAG: magnesium/cobalt transporter CorA [Candidatus Subteraquimicrobiales bacterium]|nr:magnesium/cobalt transporter CorA [Candidatus Subteraquimicrobiales bacterium]
MVKILISTGRERLITDISLAQAKEYFKREDAVVWIDIEEPSEEEFNQLLSALAFHPLTIEDCKSPFHLPKIDVYEDYLFIIWHAIIDILETSQIETSAVNIYLGKNFMVTVRRSEVVKVKQLRDHLLEFPEKLGKGVDWLLHSLFDDLVDDIFLLVDRISDEIDSLEDLIFESPQQEHIRKLFRLKHQLLTLRKVAAPQREIVSNLLKYDSLFFSKETYIYFQDIADHLIRIVDLVDTARDVIGGTIEIYLSSISNRLNEIMKRLTILATIFGPLTVITGVYGMNFDYMPELRWQYSYFLILFGMFIFALGMFAYFKQKKWW